MNGILVGKQDRRNIVKNFSVILLAIAVVIELASLVGTGRYADLFSQSIESTELWRGTWPAPGGQLDVAGARSKSPLSASVPADRGAAGVTTR